MALMMEVEAASTSETSVNFYQSTLRNNPEDSHLQTRRRENLKCLVHCHFYRFPQLFHILKHISVYNFTPHFLKIYFNIIFPYTLHTEKLFSIHVDVHHIENRHKTGAVDILPAVVINSIGFASYKWMGNTAFGYKL
jgi:hypothetical protein